MLFLSSVENDRNNNFNLLRMILATSVVLSHSYILTGGWEAARPLENALGFTLGTLAVFGFFAISGFLITRSFINSRTTLDWISARIARVYPAFLIVVLFMAFVLGPFLTELSAKQYFQSLQVYSYVITHVFMLDPAGKLPGVFQTLPVPEFVNGPLWTIMYELICYSGVLVIGVLGLFQSKRICGFILALIVMALIFALYTNIADIDGGRIIGRLVILAFPFALGTAFYIWRDYIPVSWSVLLGLLVTTYLINIFSPAVLYPVALIASVSYMMIVLAYSPGGVIRSYNYLGDYSYGIYITAWPIQQLLVFYIGDHSPVENFLMAISISFFVAALSWHFVEEPCLSRKKYLAKCIEHKLSIVIRALSSKRP